MIHSRVLALCQDHKLLLQREDAAAIARVPDTAVREPADTRARLATTDDHVGNGSLLQLEEVPVTSSPKPAGVVSHELRDLAPRPATTIRAFALEELGVGPVDDLLVDDDARSRRRFIDRAEPGDRLDAERAADGNRLRLVQTTEVDLRLSWEFRGLRGEPIVNPLKLVHDLLKRQGLAETIRDCRRTTIVLSELVVGNTCVQRHNNLLRGTSPPEWRS